MLESLGMESIDELMDFIASLNYWEMADLLSQYFDL